MTVHSIPPVGRARASYARAGWIVLSTMLAGCHGEEGTVRRRIAGNYVREIDGRPTTAFFVRQVLTLRPDGSWLLAAQVDTKGVQRESPPDSGTYRVEGVTLALRSAVEPGAVPMRYTVSGDSLFSANAAQVHTLTGYDGGEEILVRAR